MDAQLKQKWVEALRSGEYQQGDSKLYDKSSNSFCCLGVLASVCGAEFIPYEEHSDDEFMYHSYDQEAVLNGELISQPESEEFKSDFAKRIGLPDQEKLMAMNDGHYLLEPQHLNHVRKHSFAEIADYIEANIPVDVDAA